jgi:hypothetical protein
MTIGTPSRPRLSTNKNEFRFSFTAPFFSCQAAVKLFQIVRSASAKAAVAQKEPVSAYRMPML